MNDMGKIIGGILFVGIAVILMSYLPFWIVILIWLFVRFGIKGQNSSASKITNDKEENLSTEPKDEQINEPMQELTNESVTEERKTIPHVNSETTE